MRKISVGVPSKICSKGVLRRGRGKAGFCTRVAPLAAADDDLLLYFFSGRSDKAERKKKLRDAKLQKAVERIENLHE